MDKELLEKLKVITPEEQKILDGRSQIEKDIYMVSRTDIVDARRLLEKGRLIRVRTHTRFVHFPKHTHNYVEMIYVCSGSTRHIVNGAEITLNQGDLLLLNQKAAHEIYPARLEDISVNFIILPEFFDYVLKMLGREESPLRDFMIGSLKGENVTSGYLHFKTAGIVPVENLVENLIWTILNKQPNKRSVNQATMGLLFLQLMNYSDRMEPDLGDEGQEVVLAALRHIEEHYRDGTLFELARLLYFNESWLSREIKERTGKTYTELLQTKRMSQAAYLLNTTAMPVSEIAVAVGYDNSSYFYRIFQEKFGMTPAAYRKRGQVPDTL